MDLTQLQELKDKLLHDAELAPVWDFFFDKLAEDPAFMELGERTNHPFLEAVVSQVGEQMYPRDATLRGLILTRLAEQQFVHGGFNMGGRWGGVIFFEDTGVGMVAVPELPPSAEVKFARFTAQAIRRPGPPSRN
jgi:hypothetical protein